MSHMEQTQIDENKRNKSYVLEKIMLFNGASCFPGWVADAGCKKCGGA